MLAARFYGPGDVRAEDVPRPRCGPGEAVVKIAYAGICGSDLHVYRKGMFVTSAPVTMGHEFSGVVEEIGEGVTGLAPGDHVIGDPRVTCGSCAWCMEKQYNLCPGLGFIGEVAPGCFAEYIAMKAGLLLKVPPNVDLKTAALAEPLAVALHIAEAGSFSGADSIGIIGAGPIGLLTLLLAGNLKVSHIAVVDLSPARLDLARELGAHSTYQSVPEFPADAVDVAVEAVGLEVTLSGAIKWLKPRGRLVMAGLYEEQVRIDPNDIISKELLVSGINAYGTEDIIKAIELLRDASLDLSPVVSHVLPLEAAPSAFSLLTSGDKSASKILLAAGA
jgi:threonine dehydrogenase-like Zn-dependent dehydrogenase